MKTCLTVVALLGSAAAPAFALNETPHFLGLDPQTHACAVLTVPTQGWKILGTYKTTEEALEAMKKAKECYGQPV